MKTAVCMRLLIISALTLLAVALLGSIQPTFAAVTGSVSGTVRNADGVAVADANVTLTNTEGANAAATALTANTSSSGTYSFAGVAPGTYNLDVTASNLQPLSSPVVIQQDFQSTVDFTLEPKRLGGATRIIVTPVRRSDPTTAYVVSAKVEQETKSQPNNLYQFPGLVFGQPGVTPDPSGYTHIRGSDYNQVGFDVDGIQVTEPMTNSFATNIVTVGLKSANVYTGSADASYGGATGGFINEITANGKDFALGDKLFGGTIEGTFGPDHGWDYRGTNDQFGGMTSNGKFDYYLSTVMFANNFPDNTQISKLVSSFDGIIKVNDYIDKNNTLTGFVSQGFESYDDYDPNLATDTMKYNQSQNAFVDTGTSQQDHDDQGYNFDYLNFKHNIGSSSFISYRLYRLKDWVTFNLANLDAEFENRGSTTVGNQLDYSNTFSPTDTLKAGLSYLASSTFFNVITGSGDWRTQPKYTQGYNDRYSGVSPDETDGYISNDLKTKDQKIDLTTGLRLAQDNYHRKFYPSYTDTYADPRLGATYSPTRDFVIRTSWSKNSEFPDSRLTEFLFPEQGGFVPVTSIDPAKQLAYYSAHYDQDNNLQTVQSQDYDLGVEKSLVLSGLAAGSYDATFTVFRRVGYDQIQANYADPSGQVGIPYPFSYNNAGHAHSSGVEVNVTKRAVKKTDWNGFVGYTNQIARANNSDFDTGYLPYFTQYEYGNSAFTPAQFAQYDNKEFPTSYDQRHTVAVVVDKRISSVFEMSAFLDAGSGFPFAGGATSNGSVGFGETSQFSEYANGDSDFTAVPTVLPNGVTLQPNNPVVGRTGWHYKITLNTNIYLNPTQSLFLNVDNIFDRKTVVSYATTTQSGAPYYIAPSPQYPQGRVYYGPSTILTPIFVTFGFRQKF